MYIFIQLVQEVSHCPKWDKNLFNGVDIQMVWKRNVVILQVANLSVQDIFNMPI